MRKYFQSAGAFLLAAAMLTGCSSAQPADEPAEEAAQETIPEGTYEVKIGATVTDAGQYVDRMTIDFGSDVRVSDVDYETFEVHMNSTVDYGAEKGNPYAYYDTSAPLKAVGVDTNDGVVTVYQTGKKTPSIA